MQAVGVQRRRSTGWPRPSIRFTVDTVPPEAPEVSVFDDESFNTQKPIIAGTAEAGSTVTVWLNGTVAAPVKADAAGTWNFTPATALEFGRHIVSATATDEAGNISPPSTEHPFIIQRSHYGWSCTTAPALPATWALLTLGLLLRRRRLRSP